MGGIDYKLEISQKLRDLKIYLVASNLEKHSQDVELNKTNRSDHMIHMDHMIWYFKNLGTSGDSVRFVTVKTLFDRKINYIGSGLTFKTEDQGFIIGIISTQNQYSVSGGTLNSITFISSVTSTGI